EEQEVPDSEAGVDVRVYPGRGATSVGWADEDWLYLLPEDSFRLVSHFLSDGNQVLGATKDSLHRALDDLGLIETASGRRTKPVMLEGVQIRVLKLKRDAIAVAGGWDEQF